MAAAADPDSASLLPRKSNLIRRLELSLTTLNDAMSVGRENNFNLLRVIAAYCVLVSHSFALVTGDPANEPLTQAFGRSLGALAVWGFFIISGLLIAQSWVRSHGLIDFVQARALRIMPGLIVALAASVVLLGPLFTSLDLMTYAMHKQTLSYLPRNATFLYPLYPLPGVFERNPHGAAVNGSLWTLSHEIACYLMLACAGLLGALKRRLIFIVLACVFVVTWVALASGWISIDAPGHYRRFVTLALPFVVGVVAFRARKFLPLNVYLLVLTCGAALFARNTQLFVPVLVLAIAYCLLWLAYVPRGPLLAFSRAGDISYGVYIYAFPIQQALIATWPHIGVGAHIASSGILVAPIAAASWYFVELPALRLRFSARAQRNRC